MKVCSLVMPKRIGRPSKVVKRFTAADRRGSAIQSRWACSYPTKAGAETGIDDIKSVADRLVYMGAISRWIRNDEATLFAGCRLLNNFITGRPLDLVG